MKIIYIITLAEHGGAQAHVQTLLAAARARAQVALVTSAEGWLTQEARALGVAVFLVPELVQPLSPWQDLRAIGALHALLRRLKPDLVHLHSSKAGLLGRVAARWAGVPAVFSAHGWAFTEGVSANRRRLALWSERLVAPLSARIVTVSAYDMALAERCRVGRPGQIVTVRNGIPDREERAAPGRGGPCRIVMTARFSTQKDHGTLLHAVARVPEVHLTLIGEGERLPEARALTVHLGVQDRVTFLGARSDVPELLRQADVFALISHYEGFPISILEAMRAGLPVVASEVGGVGEAVQSAVNGFLVPRADPEAVVAALRTLASDAALRHAMGRASREWFEQEFTEATMVEAIWNIYLDVLRPSAQGAGPARTPQTTSS